MGGTVLVNGDVVAMEFCADMCLGTPECHAFQFHPSGACRLFRDDVKSLAYDSMTSFGVRCNLASPSTKAADRTYQMNADDGQFKLYVPPGEKILFYITICSKY